MDYSSSITPPSSSFKYDVFLSFSREDTRYRFVSHLYEAMRDKQIEVYVDQLQKGEEISSDLLKIIEESKISVIIFSKNYAASRWRLDEVDKVIECKHRRNQTVIPVYYDIEPADLRRQINTFAAAVKKHKDEDYDIVQRWAAIKEATNISGFGLRDFKSESELKQAIVKEISNTLNRHAIYIREEDRSHEDKDEEAIQVPKITVERMFMASNLILEVPSAVFDQLSSVHKPQYVLLSMLMSLTAMLICTSELVYKGGEARVGWRWGKKKIPWFYHPSPSDKPFGTVTDFIGLLCSFCQCIFSVSDYVFYLRNINDPIKISFWPLVFAFCLLCCTFLKKSHKKML